MNSNRNNRYIIGRNTGRETYSSPSRESNAQTVAIGSNSRRRRARLSRSNPIAAMYRNRSSISVAALLNRNTNAPLRSSLIPGSL